MPNTLEHSQIFTPDGTANDRFSELLQLFAIEQRDVEGVSNVLQAKWYQDGTFRYAMVDTAVSSDNQAAAMALLRELGFMSAIDAAEGGQHRYAQILGATVVAVRKRLALARKCWVERGVRFEGVELLGAVQRGLQGPNESVQSLYDGTNADLPFDPVEVGQFGEPKNEAEMMELQARLAERVLPWTSVIPTRLTATPPQVGRNTNVGDTTQAWLDQYQPEPGKVLAVASQPYTSQQGLAIQNTLGAGWEVEAIGYEAPASVKLGGYLDNVAKLVYETLRSTRG